MPLKKRETHLSIYWRKQEKRMNLIKKLAVSDAITELKEGYEKLKNNLDKVELQKELSEKSIKNEI